MTYDFEPAIDLVLVDRIQVQQVVLNLVRNAVDAMAQSSSSDRALTIKIGSAEDGLAKVVVSDTGPGIDPEVADRLFQPFITTKRTGMGVGLSISRTIIEAHGGKIFAAPSPAGGAMFGFTVQAVTKEELHDGQ